MKSYRVSLVAAALSLALAAKPAVAGPDPYDDSQSHPLRILAYLLHPAAVVTEWLVFRPFHHLVSATEAQETLFGHRNHPPVLSEPQPYYDYGMPKRVPLAETKFQIKQQQQQPAAAAQPPAPEQVRIVEVPVEKVVVKEVQKIVEVEKFIFPAVAFDFDSAYLTDLGKGQVYLAAQRLKARNDMTLVIEGHADSRGNDDYNQKLGMQRAQTVMTELANLGIERSRMSAASVGESKPLIEGDARWARAVNRRVELQIKGK
ncbi:MAG: OmpA family protein [Deltaproteobacteria bacterium]|nr:OmpA family protein [Deltaproteobacteria bacterium]